MSNIVKFPKAKQVAPPIQVNTERIKAPMPPGATVTTVLKWMWLIVRVPLFLVLYWLRMPVILVCNFISVPLLFAWLFAWYAFPEKTAMVWGFAALSLAAFVVMWLYDIVLMLLSPQEMIHTL
jgi:hypothetical protein